MSKLNVVLIVVIIILLLSLSKKESYGQSKMYYNQVPDNWAWNAAPSASSERFDQGNIPLAVAESERLNLMNKLGCSIPQSYREQTPNVVGAIGEQARQSLVNACGSRN